MRKWCALSAVLLSLFLTAPWAEGYRGTVTVALTGEPPTMDPHIESNFIGTMIWPWVTDKLVARDVKTGKIVPWLAEKFERLDAKRYKFTLRENAKFTDGTPVTSAAIAYSISRIFDPANKSRQLTYWKSFDRIEIIDDRTFIMHNKTPENGLFNRLLSWGHAVSMNTRTMKKEDISRKPVGSGPYTIQSWVKGVKMVFEANPNWWGNSMFPDRPKTIVLRSIRESATRIKALQAGEVDIITGVLPHMIPIIKKDAKLEVASVPAVRILYLGFFTEHQGPFANQKVRLAVNYAIEAELIRKTILQGYADLFGQLLHPWTYSGYNEKKQWWGFDLEKAKALMAEAGYPNGFRAELIATNGRYPGDQPTCEAIVGMLKKIKITTTCNAMAFPLYQKSFLAYKQGKKKGAAMYYQGFGNGAGDSALSLRGLVACKGAWSGHCFPDVEKAIDLAASTAEPKAQQVAYERVTDMIKEKATHKVMFKIHDIFGYNKRLEFTPPFDESLSAWTIVVKEGKN